MLEDSLNGLGATMKRTLLIVMVLAGLTVPSALVAQTVVVPNGPDSDWWWWELSKNHSGVPPLAFVRPFPTPVPHVGNPPIYHPSPFPAPTSGTGVLVHPSAPVLVRPNPIPYSPLVIVPFVEPLWDFYSLPEDAYSADIQPSLPYTGLATQNGTPQNARAAANNWEVGISETPNADPQTNTWDALVGFHFAYAWNILYFSWDSIAVPDYMVQAWTGGYVDSSGNYVIGYSAPGFLNLWDVGLRLILGPVVGDAEVGVNNLYVYQQGLLAGGLGANLRLGAGMKFGFWGFSLAVTSLYESWNDLTYTIGGLFSSDTQESSWSRIAQSLVPSLQLSFYF